MFNLIVGVITQIVGISLIRENPSGAIVCLIFALLNFLMVFYIAYNKKDN